MNCLSTDLTCRRLQREVQEAGLATHRVRQILRLGLCGAAFLLLAGILFAPTGSAGSADPLQLAEQATPVPEIAALGQRVLMCGLLLCLAVGGSLLAIPMAAAYRSARIQNLGRVLVTLPANQLAIALDPLRNANQADTRLIAQRLLSDLPADVYSARR